jgi:RNA-directed DNA polymerase
VQGALKLILEPIFDADFQEGSYGYRPKRTAHEAVEKVTEAAIKGKMIVSDVDLKSYFDTVVHSILLEKIATRVDDKDVMHLLKLILKTSGKLGIPQGSPLPTLASNIYLNEIDKMQSGLSMITPINCRSNLRWSKLFMAKEIICGQIKTGMIMFSTQESLPLRF